MDKKQAEEFTKTIDLFGTGWYRQVLLADDLKVWKLLGHSTLQDWIKKELKGWKKYTVSDRRKIVVELTSEGKSQREIAAVLGVNQSTIHEDLKADGNPSKKAGSTAKADGNPSPSASTGINAPDKTAPPVSGSKVPPSASTIRKQEGHPESDEPPVKNGNMVNRLQSLTGEFEWYTPEKYLNSVKKIFGRITLDPASSEIGQQLVDAEKYYTEQEDGLTFPWEGKVFLNPPYAMPYIKNFVSYLVDEYKSGRVSEAILLTNAATDTSWYSVAVAAMTAKCDTTGRISFLENIQGEFLERTSPACGQTFFYFGPNRITFAEEFRQHGWILSVVKTKKSS